MPPLSTAAWKGRRLVSADGRNEQHRMGLAHPQTARLSVYTYLQVARAVHSMSRYGLVWWVHRPCISIHPYWVYNVQIC